ncbi:N-acetylmuramoyl-L-alanine amidase [Ornithinibacillus xuwenensis]|uniref:N-acetylmuramoyl-L-alanine amidase n=1 Tax=Ornithinibacillus xuwenensis TaxID=3144668 RepID=A0ABU9XPG0_9BACI
MRKIMNMFLITGILVIIFSLTPQVLAHAESVDNGKLFEVDISYLNMRAAPDDEAEIVGQLVKGNKLRTFDEENGWVKTFFAGKPVWVFSEHLTALEEAATIEEIDQDPKDEIEAENKVEKQYKEKTEAQESEATSGETFSLEHPTEGKITLPIGMTEPNKVQISEDSITVTKEQLAGYHILIDAGHGGKDSGAISKDVYEKTLTLSTAQKVADQLTLKGAEVELTREDDTFIPLEDRVQHSNNDETDVFISLHYDYFEDPSANGVTTYYHDQSSQELAKDIQDSLMGSVSMTDRGIRKADYYVLVNNSKPALLLELGFMSNPDNLEVIQTEEYQDTVAEAITDGLLEYFEEEE